MPTRTTTTAEDIAGRAGVRPVASPSARARRQAVRSAGRAAAVEHRLLWLLAIGRRGLFLGLALAVLIAFIAGTVEQRWKEAQLRDQVTAQRTTLQAAEERNARLRAQLADADPAAYRAWVEDTARRQLNLGYSGETIYLVNWADPAPGASSAPAPSPVAQAAAAPPAEANWRKWWRLISGQ